MVATTRRAQLRATGWALAGVMLAGALTACDFASGDEGEGGAFAGEDVDLVVPYEPGGGYDTYARALVPYLEQCLGATVVVRNEPGAAGLRATIETATADPDDNRLQIVNTGGLIPAQIADPERVNFDLNDLHWIGRVDASPNVVVVAQDNPIQGFADLVNAGQPVRFVAQGPASNDFITSNIVGAAYGFPFKVITGFEGSGEARTAMVAGDADAHILRIDSQLSAIESGDVRPIVTIDDKRHPLLPDTPTIYEAAPPAAETKVIIDSLVALGQTGRGLIASPKMPAERVDALRQAFQCAVGNEALLAEMEQQRRPLNFLGGPDTAQLVAAALDPPEEFRQLVVASY